MKVVLGTLLGFVAGVAVAVALWRAPDPQSLAESKAYKPLVESQEKIASYWRGRCAALERVVEATEPDLYGHYLQTLEASKQFPASSVERITGRELLSMALKSTLEVSQMSDEERERELEHILATPPTEARRQSPTGRSAAAPD